MFWDRQKLFLQQSNVRSLCSYWHNRSQTKEQQCTLVPTQGKIKQDCFSCWCYFWEEGVLIPRMIISKIYGALITPQVNGTGITEITVLYAVDDHNLSTLERSISSSISFLWWFKRCASMHPTSKRSRWSCCVSRFSRGASKKRYPFINTATYSLQCSALLCESFYDQLSWYRRLVQVGLFHGHRHHLNFATIIIALKKALGTIFP